MRLPSMRDDVRVRRLFCAAYFAKFRVLRECTIFFAKRKFSEWNRVARGEIFHFYLSNFATRRRWNGKYAAQNGRTSARVPEGGAGGGEGGEVSTSRSAVLDIVS